MKLTISEYATRKDLSLSAVYKQIKAGKLRPVEESGKKYIVIDGEEEPPAIAFLGKVEELSKENATLQAELDKLREKLDRLAMDKQALEAQVKALQDDKGFLQLEMQHKNSLLDKQAEEIKNAGLRADELQKQLFVAKLPAKNDGFFARLFRRNTPEQ